MKKQTPHFVSLGHACVGHQVDFGALAFEVERQELKPDFLMNGVPYYNYPALAAALEVVKRAPRGGGRQARRGGK